MQVKLHAALRMPLKPDNAAANAENVSAGLEFLDQLLADDDVTGRNPIPGFASSRRRP